MFFTSKSKLIRALDSLAIYNDKGVAWSGHSSEQSQIERTKRMSEINELVSKVGEKSLPPEFLEAIQSGALAVDITGVYVEKLKQHFRHRNKKL